MSTAQTIIDRVRLKVRDTKGRKVSDASYLLLINETVEDIHNVLINIGSNLVADTATFNTTKDVQVYTGDTNIIAGSMFVGDNAMPLTQVDQSVLQQYIGNTGEPIHYFRDSTTDLTLIPTPDQTYKISYRTVTSPTAITANTDTLPFFGIFDRAILDSVTVLIFDILERQDQRSALRAEASMSSAMVKAYDYGVQETMQVSDMFTADGC